MPVELSKRGRLGGYSRKLPTPIPGPRLRQFPTSGDAAVGGASLHADPGEVRALVGESGAGKTTLIRAIQGLQKPTSGSILVEGKPIDAKTKKEIQTIFQNPAVKMV